MTNTVKILGVVTLTAFLAAGCSKTSSSNSQASASPQPSPTSQTAPAASQKFTDQSYYGSTYLISGDTLSSDAKMALTGFAMGKKTLADGSTQITLTAQKAGYQDQQFTLRPGDQLYLIEKFLGDDDNEANEDKNMSDDMAVVVDSQGNVVGQPGGYMPAMSPQTPAK